MSIGVDVGCVEVAEVSVGVGVVFWRAVTVFGKRIDHTLKCDCCIQSCVRK